MKVKNIFAVSLIAVMAAGAARADIASTDYVLDRTGDTSKIAVEGATELTGAVNALNTKLGTVTTTAGNAATKTELSTAVSNINTELGKKELIANKVTSTTDVTTDAASTTKFPSMATANKMIDNKLLTTTNAINAEKAAREEADAELQDAIDANKGTLDTLTGSGAGSITQQINNAVTNIENTLGEDYATKAELKTTDDKAVKNASDIAAINNETTGILAQAKADATSKANAAQSAATTAAATDATNKVNVLANGAVKTNTDAIAAINNATTGIAATAKKYTDAEIAKINTSIDTITDDYATKEELTDGLAAKQATLTTAQLAAANSGITSAKVTAYDGLDAKITAAKTQADKGVTDAKTANDAIAAMDLAAQTGTGVIKTVTQVDGKVTATREAVVDADIATNAAIAQSKISGLTTALNAKANTSDLSALATATIPTECANKTAKCVLTYDGTAYAWEVIGR